jgi:hypothetical protein
VMARKNCRIRNVRMSNNVVEGLRKQKIIPAITALYVQAKMSVEKSFAATMEFIQPFSMTIPLRCSAYSRTKKNKMSTGIKSPAERNNSFRCFLFFRNVFQLSKTIAISAVESRELKWIIDERLQFGNRKNSTYIRLYSPIHLQ